MYELVRLIRWYVIDYYWYEMMDEIGNAETDEDSREELNRQILYSIENDFTTVLDYFLNEIEEAENNNQKEDARAIYNKLVCYFEKEVAPKI